MIAAAQAAGPTILAAIFGSGVISALVTKLLNRRRDVASIAADAATALDKALAAMQVRVAELETEHAKLKVENAELRAELQRLRQTPPRCDSCPLWASRPAD